MRSLVVLVSFFGFGAAFPWQLPQQVEDTPEVAAAKAAHLNALAKAHAKKIQDKPWTGNRNTLKEEEEDNGLWTTWKEGSREGEEESEDDGAWKDDESWKSFDDGSWKEDDIVETTTKSSEPTWSPNASSWKGPIALPPGYDSSGAPLPVEDTPEVAAAKARHLQAYVKVATKLAQNSPKSVQSVKSKVVSNKSKPIVSQKANPYVRAVPSSPAPVWEAIGLVEDTPEVAAAKAVHFAAYAKLKH